MSRHSSRNALWPTLAVLFGVYLLVIAIPADWKPFLPSFLNPPLHLGLDLQGGTQLDFRISEVEMLKQKEQLKADVEELKRTNGPAAEIADKQAQIDNITSLEGNIVEAIRTVLERRINNLGVSEATITPSYYGAEKHLLVECPGIVDVQKCISTVGKTILLEFKEQSEGEDEEHIATMRSLAEESYADATLSGKTLETIGQDIGSTLGVIYSENQPFYQDQLFEGMEDLWDASPADPPVLREITVGISNVNDVPTPHRGLILVQPLSERTVAERVFTDPREAMRHIADTNDNASLAEQNDILFDDLDEGYKTLLPQLVTGTLIEGTRSDATPTILLVTDRTESRETVEASHILVAYQGAARAETDVVRTREEALEYATTLKSQLDEGADFAKLAREESDGPSAVDDGKLGAFSKGDMSLAFEQAAFSMQEGEISDPIETEFGFHIIRSDGTVETSPGKLNYLELAVQNDTDNTQRKEWFTGLQNRTIAREEEQIALRTVFFSFLPTGWKDTSLDGKHFQRATVTTDPLMGSPVVQIVFDTEGGRLFQELTARNIGKPIAIFVGGELVSAPTVQTEIAGGVAIITGSRTFEEANTLAQDLNTGAIPAPIYLVGQSTVEASLGDQALNTSMKAAAIGFILVIIYMIFYYRILGVIAAVSLCVYAIIFFALLKLPLLFFTGQYIVLTLAGIAGIILSIGMAVDANVLIFERMKEELRKGKLLETAAKSGFKRAWTSIWDSNVSTLITAFILFIIGTSIVRGFAVTLSLGILISMFSAVVVTRFLISLLYNSPIAKNTGAFGVTSEK